MTTETMTIHEALSELKMLNKRISAEIRGAYVNTTKRSNTKIGGKSIKEYEESIKSHYQTVRDLMARRAAIKRAVVQSNAETKVEINGKQMSVAEAIEYRDFSIDFLRTLLSEITTQYQRCVSAVERANGSEMTANADRYIEALYGSKDSGINAETIEATRNAYIESNSYDLIDPLKADKVIKEISEEIEGFESKVDSVLSVSNALTTITISY